MKKLTALILTMSVVCSLIPPVKVNADNTVVTTQATINDALAILKHLAGVEELSPVRRVTLDLNGDFNITIADVLVILKGLAGITARPHVVVVPELQIKQDYLDFTNEIGNIDNVRLIHYYGTYNGSVALLITMSVAWLPSTTEYIVAGYRFFYPNLGPLTAIWNDGKFYRLFEAYDEGLLTDQDVGNIWRYRSYQLMYDILNGR
jgi:hypothetical protein